ncbi:Tetratricopeptide TPR_2 protein [Ignavibacterium album JCM 16511]|uniref:Tetratricopeptide TPR_2 protein n=1 Tax=Ignavibacterium album (strain DSM 19864 / JCM 16511 / NBRC 101810 / Mat9-16) TaxID=945713 RepID=I0AL78_IGNAJ|nr:tetratricopeptide repeat protein [Ignavibacterium album]AFH49735.1 Tetratricopeptide TPR_2 protein [Ignavibacterium album JCM 16511]
MKILTLIFLSLFLSFYSFGQSDQAKLLNDSKGLIASGRFAEAIELLNRFVAANPQSSEGFYLRGICHEKRGNYERAVYDYRTAIRISPDDKLISENLKRAENDWYRLLYNQIEGYKREIAINPSVAKNYLEIGKCYKNLGEWNEAEIWYDIFLEKEEASADEMLRYAEILAKNNHISKGKSYLKEYVEKYPDDHRLWSRYGYFLYWLGKSKSAENVFTKALQIRPFFKEALDGLDLVKGKKVLYTVNDTTYKFKNGKIDKVYLIDKYMKSLKRNPDNDDLRFKLIEEFIKYDRIEEAYEQLQFLSEKFYNDQKYKELYAVVFTKRNDIIDRQIEDLKNTLIKNPYDKNSLIKLAELLSYRNKSEEAIHFLEEYLTSSDDNEVRFLLAKYLFWNSNFCESKNQLEMLIENNYQIPEAELMLAKIYLWFEVELQRAEYLFEKYLSEIPDDKEAITFLIETNLKLGKFSDAEKIIIDKRQLFTFSEVENFNESIKEFVRLKKLSAENNILEEARAFASEKQYQIAIKKYLEFLNAQPENIQAKSELADVYSANSEFEKSNKIFEEILFSNYDFEIDKKRAKNIFWSKNYSAALREFKRLSLKYPNDVEIKLFLADSYLFTGEQEKARSIYYELLNQSPESYILNQRLVWLGDKPAYTGFNFSLQLIPAANYFNDNQDLTYSGQSFLLRTALTNNFAFGGAIHRGNLSSVSEERNLYLVKGMLNLRISEMINTEASFGQIFFNNSDKQFFADFNFTVDNPDNYFLRGFYKRTDAALELYSPSLVDKRFYLNYIGLELAFYPGLNFIINTRYHLLLPEDKNQGQQFTFRIGNQILRNFSAGYELYYYTFNNNSAFYWSPQDFISHSLWIELKIINSSKTFLKIGGKAGIIPENNYVLSEASGDFGYNFIQNFSFNLYISGGKTYRKETGGYGSFSVISSLLISL